MLLASHVSKMLQVIINRIQSTQKTVVISGPCWLEMLNKDQTEIDVFRVGDVFYAVNACDVIRVHCT